MSQNFTVFDPLENVVKTIDGISQLGTSFSFIGKNTTTNVEKNIQIIGPQASNVKNYDYYWPSSVPNIGEILSVSAVSGNTDTETITFGWITGGGTGVVFSETGSNIFNISSGVPLGANNFIGGVGASPTLRGSNSVIIGYSAGCMNLYDDNIILGYQALNSVSSYIAGANTSNIAVGTSALTNANGVSAGQNKGNICIGDETGITITTGSGNICIGENADVSVSNANNQIVVGQNAIGKANNTVLLGNSLTRDVFVGSGNPGNPASVVFYGDDFFARSPFIFKIKASTNAAMNSNREIILPSGIPVFGNLMGASAVSTGGGTTTATLNWFDRPQLTSLFLNNNNIAQDTMFQLYNRSASNNNFLYFFKDRVGGLDPLEVIGQEVKYGYNSTGSIWAGMTAYTFCNSSTAGVETASTTWESMYNGSLEQVFGFVGHDIILPKTTISRILYTNSNKYIKSAVLQGTTNQISVTGSGTSMTVLSTPQDIATTSSPEFRGVILGGSTSGTIGLSAGTSPTSYTLTLPSTAGTNGYVLTTDGNGITSWTAPSSLGVSSLRGTASRILVNGTTGSAQTGNVTLTLPQDIGTTSDVRFRNMAIYLGGRLATITGGITMSDAAQTTSIVIGGPSTATTNYTFRLPPTAGTNNYILATDGTGVTSWQNITTVIGGNLSNVALSADIIHAANYISTDGYFQLNDQLWRFYIGQTPGEFMIDSLLGVSSIFSIYENTNGGGSRCDFRIYNPDLVHSFGTTLADDSLLCTNAASNFCIGTTNSQGYRLNVAGSLNASSVYINGTQTYPAIAGSTTPNIISGLYANFDATYTTIYYYFPTTNIVFFYGTITGTVTTASRVVAPTLQLPVGNTTTAFYGTVTGFGVSDATGSTIPGVGTMHNLESANQIELPVYFPENVLIGSSCTITFNVSYKKT